MCGDTNIIMCGDTNIFICGDTNIIICGDTNIIICGDTNISLLNVEYNSRSADYLDMFMASSFIPAITKPSESNYKLTHTY